ncbi:MAG: flagellar assembly protein H, partial [Cyanobacteriota bacterium SKYGB_h_bin112]|nr:flagellar assembly protein H [Cyanobacteriota bacterium SKYGB_h_bin112]
MSRILFDQLAKHYLEDFLEPLGTVQRNLEVPGEPKFVDLWFTPNPDQPAPIDLGLLSRIATTPCLLEPFRNAPTHAEIRSCLLKLLWLQDDHRRTTKRQKADLNSPELPRLWVLAATT